MCGEAASISAAPTDTAAVFRCGARGAVASFLSFSFFSAALCSWSWLSALPAVAAAVAAGAAGGRQRQQLVPQRNSVAPRTPSGTVVHSLGSRNATGALVLSDYSSTVCVVWFSLGLV